MRARCPTHEREESGCEGLKDLRVGDKIVTLNLTTAHFASEQWMDWK